MDKSLTTPEHDIATEPYQGPSAKVEAAGHGFLEHLFYAFGGLATFGTLAFIFHQPAAKLVEKSRALGTRLKSEHYDGVPWGKAKDSLTNWAGGFLHVVFGDTESAAAVRELSKHAKPKDVDWLSSVATAREQGFGHALLSHTIGLIPLIGKPFRETLTNASPRWKSAIAVGGFAGALGYVGGWLKAAVLGAKHGNRGKRQFERAQSEIHALREKNEDLEKVNERLRHEHVEVKDAAGQDNAGDAPSLRTHAHAHQGMVEESKQRETEIA